MPTGNSPSPISSWYVCLSLWLSHQASHPQQLSPGTCSSGWHPAATPTDPQTFPQSPCCRGLQGLPTHTFLQAQDPPPPPTTQTGALKYLFFGHLTANRDCFFPRRKTIQDLSVLFLSQALKLAWASPSQQRALEPCPGLGLRSRQRATLNLLGNFLLTGPQTQPVLSLSPVSSSRFCQGVSGSVLFLEFFPGWE